MQAPLKTQFFINEEPGETRLYLVFKRQLTLIKAVLPQRVSGFSWSLWTGAPERVLVSWDGTR